MAFNYSKPGFHFSSQLLMITSFFLLSSLIHRQTLTGNWKKSDTSLSNIFSFYSFWHIRKWKMIRHLSTEIETDILMETYKANTFFTTKRNEKKRCIINESLSYILLSEVSWTRGVHYYGMISLIKHFTVYRL